MSEWTDIGEQLKLTREKKKISLAGISHEMRIPVATLRALEENDYSGFPSPSYAKSFLGQYSEFLNIDADEWLDCFETGNVLTHSENLDYLVQDEPQPSRPTKARSGPKPRKKEVRESSGKHRQTAVICLVTGGLIAGAIWGFLQIEKKITSSDLPVASQEESTNPQAPQPENSSPTTPTTVEETPIILPPVAVISGDPAASGVEDPILVEPVESKPPPRAILVEED